MPRVTEKPVKAYAHCTDPRCPGYTQTEVDGIEQTSEWTFAEQGGRGSIPGVEKSLLYINFANEGDNRCPDCNGPREVSTQKRRSYANLSGKPQSGLLEIKPPERQVA